MPYATVQDMIDEFGIREMQMISDPDNTGEMDPARVENALSKASEQIDFSAGQRCALPLAIASPSVATFLKQLCMDIARYRLTGASGITATDVVKDRYKEADAKLDKIVSGKIVLCEQGGPGIGSGNQGMLPENMTAGEASFDAAPRVFGPGSLRDFIGRRR
jgi:phage gp36-like protein